MAGVHRRRRLMGEINVVPYIDVMLVLLIIFMITAPLLTTGIEVELPQAGAEALDPELLREHEPLVLTVDRDGRYFLNIGADRAAPVAEAEVLRRTRIVIGRNAATPVLVRADERVPYGRVVRGMALLQEAGAPRIGFVTDPRAARALDELGQRP
ncbi:MAG: protein TolR [Gammaproteobacteria bacterium]|nr:protein TolR [Gammaproteobacteria bacterium]